MLADCLTKVMDANLMRTALQLGRFRIFDEDLTLKQNANRKYGVTWANENMGTQSNFEDRWMWFQKSPFVMFHHSIVLGTSDAVDNRLRSLWTWWLKGPFHRNLVRKSDCGVSHLGALELRTPPWRSNIQLRTTSFWIWERPFKYFHQSIHLEDKVWLSGLPVWKGGSYFLSHTCIYIYNSIYILIR